MTKKSFFFLSLLALASPNCGDADSANVPAEGAHSHDGTTHEHADEEFSASVTLWTEDLELFMEHPTLRVGRPAKFAVHLTRLRDFRPVESGPVLFQFVCSGAPPKMVTVGTPEVPGIFGPTVTFDQAGDYTLQLEILSDQLETSLEYGPISVLDPSQEPAGDPADEATSGQTISYLKEQQWQLPFASAPVQHREIQETKRVPAQIRSKAGWESVVTPALSGRYLPPQRGVPSLGGRVGKGDLLGYIELLPADRSGLLDSRVGAGISVSRLSQDLAQAEAAVAAERARLELAEKEARRVQALVEAEALPRKRLDEVQSELQVRSASLGAALQALSTYREASARYQDTVQALDSIQDRLPLQAAISGQIVESGAVPGQYVDAREMLFRIVDLSRVWVEGQVFEKDLPGIEDLLGATLLLPGLDQIRIEPRSLILVGSTIDPETRTLPLVFEVANPDRRIKLGTMGRLDLETGGAVQALAVPKSAVLAEENRSVVYVQLEGETFERRLVNTGAKDQAWIEIIEGLEEGERIVTIGAYDVALASRSTQVPEHGHVH